MDSACHCSNPMTRKECEKLYKMDFGCWKEKEVTRSRSRNIVRLWQGNRNDIWRWNLAHRFCAQLPNGETNHAEGEALNTQQEIWMRYRLAEKCVIRSAHLKVLCVSG